MSRTFVITGGAKGIGRCMVEYFASKGDIMTSNMLCKVRVKVGL
mgnify:CR=1 FL=1